MFSSLCCYLLCMLKSATWCVTSLMIVTPALLTWDHEQKRCVVLLCFMSHTFYTLEVGTPFGYSECKGESGSFFVYRSLLSKTCPCLFTWKMNCLSLITWMFRRPPCTHIRLCQCWTEPMHYSVVFCPPLRLQLNSVVTKCTSSMGLWKMLCCREANILYFLKSADG